MKTKTMSPIRRVQRWLWVSVLTALGCGFMLTAQEGPSIEGLRNEAAELRAKTQELKADGQHEQARELAARADALIEKAQQLQQERRVEGDPEPRERRRAAAEEQLGHMKREIQELAEAGRHDQARRLEARARNLAQRLEAVDRPAEPRERRGPEAEPQDMQRRIHHLRAAAENLHAIGMHEPADRFMREAEAIEQGLRGRRPAPERQALGQPLEELHAQMAELHNAVRELRERLDRLERERR